MFTLKEIDNIHDRLGKQSSLPEYLHALHSVGVVRQHSFVADGHSEYENSDDKKLIGPPAHDPLEIPKGLADCNIEKRIFDTVKMTVTYIDSQGMAVLVEPVE